MLQNMSAEMRRRESLKRFELIDNSCKLTPAKVKNLWAPRQHAKVWATWSKTVHRVEGELISKRNTFKDGIFPLYFNLLGSIPRCFGQVTVRGMEKPPSAGVS